MNLWVRLGVIGAGEKRLDYCNGWNYIAAEKGSTRQGDGLVGLRDGLKEGGWFSNILRNFVMCTRRIDFIETKIKTKATLGWNTSKK